MTGEEAIFEWYAHRVESSLDDNDREDFVKCFEKLRALPECKDFAAADLLLACGVHPEDPWWRIFAKPDGSCATARALGYAEHGIRVFPCQPNRKIPFGGGRGCLDATIDPVTITDWWSAHPDANIAIATGDGLCVIDIDTKGGADGWGSLDALMAEHGELPGTRWAQTPSGGAHLYFKVSGEVRNSAGKLGPGLDVRGDGGYVLAPPSVIDGSSYAWMGRSPSAQLPPAWEALLIAEPDAPVAVTVPVSLPRGKKARQAYLLAALEGERDELRTAPEGTRNHALNKYGFALGQLVHLGLLADDIVASAEWAMSQWTWTHGRRDRRKDALTLGRALRDGMNHPREEVAA